VIILDENLDQHDLVHLLSEWYPGAVKTVTHLAPKSKGTDDPDLLRYLYENRDCIFITKNAYHFWRRVDGHPRYCILCLSVDANEADRQFSLIKSVLQQPPFRRKQSRSGLVIRAVYKEAAWYRRKSDPTEFVIVFETGEISQRSR